MKVLYVNHYGVFGGAQRSILELITAFPEGAVEPFFFTPYGRVVSYLKKLGINYTIVWGGLSKFDHTRMGHYHGLRWLILLRELLYIIPTIYTFLRFRKKAREMDIIHINEITCLVPMILAKKLYKKPVVVHARVVFNNNPAKWQTRWIIKIVKKYADYVIAIDDNIASSLPFNGRISVVHNSFASDSPFSKGSELFKETIASIPRGHINVGFIGAIHHNKGIFDLLEAARLCRDNHLNVKFIIAGNAKFRKASMLHSLLKKFGIDQDRNAELHSYISDNELQNYIYPLGFSSNTGDFFRFIDIISFPTYYDTLGRPVFEAAFFGKPSIVAVKKAFPDTFIEGVTGLKVEEGSPQSIFNAIKGFYEHPEWIETMGKEAFKLASVNFDGKTNALKVLDIYQSLINHSKAAKENVHTRA